MEPLGILINSSPMIGEKTGIGFYVYNLCRELEQHPEIELTYSHRSQEESSLSGIGIEDLDNLLKKISKPLKIKFGNYYPASVAATTYNFFLYPLVALHRRRIKKEIKSGKLQIYHETRHSILPDFKKQLAKIRLVADIHDLSPITHPQWHLKEHVREVNRSIPQLLAADHIITKSNYVRQEIIERFNVNPDKITAIPNAAGGAYRQFSGTELEQAKSHVATFTDGRPFLLYVGTIEPRKNIITLIDAFCHLSETYDGDLLLAGGYGWLYQDILDHAEQTGLHNRIRFLGYARDETIHALFNLCDLFVYPSWYEGFGMPALEAMSCGAVPVVSDCSSLPEVVQDGGAFFDPNSSDDLASTILSLLNDQQRLIALKKRASEISKQYQWPDIAQRVINIYKKVCT
ncbi:MAG: glycosyltransferase family 4 protein [Deltaproteobacteria bacterium]|nr:glycosyltransferase family 4 protein [Deltaproteobacteria bacterium]